MPKVTSMHKSEVRDKIVQAAIESFGHTGFDRTKMDDIAKRMGVSKGTLYLYFKSKEDLFLAICERHLQESNEQDSAFFTNKENIAADAGQMYDNIRQRERGMDKVMLEMVVESGRNPKLRKVMHQYQSMIHRHVAEEIKKKVGEGFVRNVVEVDSLALALVALYDGFVLNRTVGMNESDNKKAWVTMVQAVIKGLS